MIKRTITLIIILGIMSNGIFAQKLDSMAFQRPLSGWGKIKHNLDNIACSKAYQMTFIGVPLIVGGLIVKKENDHFKDLRNCFAPNFDNSYDDYLQYTPAALMLALKVSGVKGRNSWPRMLVSDAFSVILMASAVNIIKSTSNTLRPDGSTRNSFPSGHTATAFMTATMLHKEYGLTRSPWYSIAGYTIATATAVGRQLNNRHWLSDVMVGAGIGILSTELGYFLADLIFKDKGITHNYLNFKNISAETPPTFFGYYLGFTMLPGLNMNLGNIRLDTSTGSSAGFEGAWFFNPYIGAGGRLRAANVPISLDSKHYFSNYYLASKTTSIQPAPTDIFSAGVGAYFSYPFTDRWLLGSKLLIDSQYSSGSGISVSYHDAPDEALKTKEVVKIEESHTVGIGTGLSATFIAKQNLSVRFFTDYDFVPSHIKFKINDENGTRNLKSDHPTHVLTLGASVNIQF